MRKKLIDIIGATGTVFSTGFWMRRSITRWAWALLAGVLATQLSSCAWLDNKQRSITYRPTPGIPADFAGLRPGDQRIFLPVHADCSAPAQCPTASSSISTTNTNIHPEPQRIELWWLPHPDVEAPTLLYLHGTFRNLYQNLTKIDSLRAAGFAVLAVDYRGWGQSTFIVPSEATIMQDARLALAELQRRETRPAQRFIYGHSMGTGVAVEMASSLKAGTDYGGLILESAFTSFSDVARQVGFVGYLGAMINTERFESILKISKVNAPLLMLHGSADNTVPMVLGKQLFDAANEPKQWVPIAGGTHSRLNQEAPVQYQAAVTAFKTAVTLKNRP